MRAEDIRAFVERPRAELELLKRQHWTARAHAGDPAALGHLLYEHAREADPGFPSARYMREDWEHHLRLKKLLDRAQTALASR